MGHNKVIKRHRVLVQDKEYLLKSYQPYDQIKYINVPIMHAYAKKHLHCSLYMLLISILQIYLNCRKTDHYHALISESLSESQAFHQLILVIYNTS